MSKRIALEILSIVAVISVVTVLVCLTACGREPVRVTEKAAMPVQRVIDGITKNDTDTYRSAFLPAYDKAVEASPAMWATETVTDFDAYLSSVITFAREAAGENVGKNSGIEFITESVTALAVADAPDMFEKYDDYLVYDYKLDLASIEEAAVVKGTVNIWGDDDEKSVSAEYVVVKCGGKWYLHPRYYLLTFS